LRSIPESLIPERARECVVKAVEDAGLQGVAFSSFVERIPHEVCAPKHAMKLRTAWKNVLAEAVAIECCKQSLDHAVNTPVRKGVQIVL